MNARSEFELPLSFLRERIANSDLLPQAYAEYRRIIADALQFFLQRLSSPRLRQIFAQQIQLPSTASTAERLVALLGQSPVLHKLGQVVARDHRLGKAFRRQLQKLESLTPRTPIAWVTRRIDAECKGWRKFGIQLGPQTLAEGSVAVIIPFVWRNGSKSARQGIFKILKPGVRSRMEEDLEILSCLAAFLDEKCHHYRLPALAYQETFETIRELLLNEMCFEQEQGNLRRINYFCHQFVKDFKGRQILRFVLCLVRVLRLVRLVLFGFLVHRKRFRQGLSFKTCHQL